MKHIGTWPCADDAAKAYDEWASRLHGEFAILNFNKPEQSAAQQGTTP